MAQFMGERRALQVIPLSNQFSVQADQQHARQGRVDLGHAKGLTSLSVPHAAIDVPMDDNLDAVDHHLTGRPNQPIKVDARARPAPQKLLADMLGNAPDLLRLQWTRFLAAPVMGVAHLEGHRRLPAACFRYTAITWSVRARRSGGNRRAAANRSSAGRPRAPAKADIK